MFPLGPGVGWKREALYRLVVIVDELSISIVSLASGTGKVSTLFFFVLLVSVLLSAREVAVCHCLPDWNL